MTSMDPARTASSVVVLRSGCSRVSPIGTTASSTASEKRCHAGRPEPRTAARTSSSPSLASSEGWKLTEPIPIHRVAPFADRPTARTATSSSDGRAVGQPSPGRRATGRGPARTARGRARRRRRSWPAATASSEAPVRYRFASPSPTSANAATTASRSKAPLRRFRRCCRVRRRRLRRAPEAAHAGPLIEHVGPLRGSLAGSGRHEPTSTGGPAATAGAPSRRPPPRPSPAAGTVPTAVACSAPARHGHRSARRGVRGARAAVHHSERPGHGLRIGCRDEPHQNTHGAGRARRARGRGCAGRPRHGSGRRRGGRHERQAVRLRRRGRSPIRNARRPGAGRRRRRCRRAGRRPPAGRPRRGPRPRAATPRSCASPRGRGRSRGARSVTRPAATVDAPGSDAARTMAPRFPDRPHQCREPARTPSRSIAAQASSSVRATTGRPARGTSATARSSSARNGSARRARRRAAPANSASTNSIVAEVAPHADDVVARPLDDARPSTTRPSMPIRTWSSSSPWVSGSGRFATAARNPTPISRACAGVSPASAIEPGELHPARRASRMRIDRRPLTLPGRAWSADELPAGLLDGTVGTGHHAHPRRNSPSTRPSPRPGLRRSWAQPPHGVTPNRRDSPKRQDRYRGGLPRRARRPPL